MDHSAIFLLIAGTYTPFSFTILRGTLGWSLFGVIWALAIAGITLKFITIFRFRKLSVVIYLLMGWLGVVAIKDLIHGLPSVSLALLVAGGLAYTAGTLFYLYRRLPFHHAFWHMFVLAGSISHYFAVLFSLR
jgi:hemolysin III